MKPNLGQPKSKGERSDDSRREQMLKVLRESEARHKRKNRQSADIGIGDQVTIRSGPLADNSATVQDLDYINSFAKVACQAAKDHLWLPIAMLVREEPR